MSISVAAPSTGRFVWRDVMSTDPEQAQAFYTQLMGWTLNPFDMGDHVYTILRNGETDFGGVVPLEASHGLPSHWISYLRVPSVDEAVARAQELDGAVGVPPTDIPNVGRFAVLRDPQGAVFSPFEELPGAPQQPEPQGMPPVGGITWNELVTSDVEGAKAFYGDLFGYRASEMTIGGGEPYTILHRGEVMEAGVLRSPDPSLSPAWIIYFHVADLDQSLGDVERLGGQRMGPVIEVPTIGRMAWAMDPTGATFALHEAAK